MARFYTPAFAGQSAGYVQEAAEISGQQCGGAGISYIGHFVANHTGRNFRIFDAKGSAESAAHIGAW